MAKCALVVVLLVVLAIALVDCKSQDRVKLRDVQVLTLKAFEKTTGRRTRAIPQLLCVGGSGRCRDLPRTVQCYNRGWDGRSVQWECKAELKSNLQFGHIEVICEGYDYPEDDYVLAGSCGLEYTLDYIDPTLVDHRPKWEPPKSYYAQSSEGWLTHGLVVFIGVFIVVAFVLSKCKSDRQDRDHTERVYPTAPPPPGFREDLYGDQKPTGFGWFGGRRSSDDRTRSSGGGFWTGFGLGNLTGWLLNRGLNSGRNYDGYGTTNNYRRESGYDYRESTPTSNHSRSQTPGTSSGDTYRLATGYGGTKRR